MPALLVRVIVKLTVSSCTRTVVNSALTSYSSSGIVGSSYCSALKAFNRSRFAKLKACCRSMALSAPTAFAVSAMNDVPSDGNRVRDPCGVRRRTRYRC